MIPFESCFITKEKFDEFIASCLKAAKLELEDKPQSVCPKVFVCTIDPETGEEGLIFVAIATDFNEWEEKTQALRLIGAKINKEKVIATAVALMSEAWISKWKGEKDKPPYRQPRYDPEKKEAILLAGMDMKNDHNVIWNQIVRRENDRMIPDGEFRKFDGQAEFPLLKHFFAGFFNQSTKPNKRV